MAAHVTKGKKLITISVPEWMAEKLKEEAKQLGMPSRHALLVAAINEFRTNHNLA